MTKKTPTRPTEMLKRVQEIEQSIQDMKDFGKPVPARLYVNLSKANVDYVKSLEDISADIQHSLRELNEAQARQRKEQSIENKKKYQHEYYLKRTKAKRAKARAERAEQPKQTEFKCIVCGATITGRSKAKKYCDECIRQRTMAKIRAWREKNPDKCKQYSRKSNQTRKERRQAEAERVDK